MEDGAGTAVGAIVSRGALATLVVMGGPVACGREPGTTPPDGPSTIAKPEGTARAGDRDAAPPRAFTYAPGAPGPAYFAMRGDGVAMLDDGAFTMVEGSATLHVHALVQGRDGGMYLLGSEGVMQLEGAAVRRVAAPPFGAEQGMLTDLAVDRDGTIWAVGTGVVTAWRDSAWAAEDTSSLGIGGSLLYGVALDGRARVWVASSNALHVREDGRWRTLDLSAHWTSPPAFDGVGTGPGGVALAVATDGLLELSSPTELRRVQVDDDGDDLLLETLGCSPTGVVGLRYNVDEVVRIDAGGTMTRWRASRDFAASSIDEVTPDDAGRLWVATDVGVAVLGPGPERVEWRSGSVAALAGRVELVGVASAGPELPRVGPVQTVDVKGRLVQAGKPLARATVELCPYPRLRFATTPCAESPTRVSATASADGRFVAKDLPLGRYGVGVKVAGAWQVVLGTDLRVRTRDDDDLGDIDVPPAKR